MPGFSGLSAIRDAMPGFKVEETDQAKLDRSKATANRAQSNKVSGQGFSGFSDQGTPCQVSVVKAQRSKDAMRGFSSKGSAI